MPTKNKVSTGSLTNPGYGAEGLGQLYEALGVTHPQPGSGPDTRRRPHDWGIGWDVILGASQISKEQPLVYPVDQSVGTKKL